MIRITTRYVLCPSKFSIIMSQIQFEDVYEDTVTCYFYSTSLTTEELYWTQLNELVNKTINLLSKDYIWHRDQLKVVIPLVEDANSDHSRHLKSTTCFGDNIEDEWFIIYVVLELSKLYKELIVQVKDSDGEFLLIEAADLLPSWVNPETADNRVFIHDGNIHIISPEIASTNENLIIKDSINIIRKLKHKTLAPLKIQQIIGKRIGNYPEKIIENNHNAFVNLPLDIATLLTLRPSLIAPLVNTYCNHDLFEAKACKNVMFENIVTVKVKFTKFLYAMLMHSKLINNIKFSKTLSQKDKKSEIGFKLACSYHMIIDNNCSTDIYNSKNFKIFLNKLIKSNYFKNNVEGSKEYNTLLEKAKSYYADLECPNSSIIVDQITQLTTTKEFFKLKQSIQDHSMVNGDEDDDSWLKIVPKQLDDLLDARYGKKALNEYVKKGINPEDISSEIKKFLNQSSDYEGIELKNDDTVAEDMIEFNPQNFVDSLKNMLDLISSENECVPDDSDDENMMEEEISDIEDHSTIRLSNSNSDIQNILKGIKEEAASTGPCSNLLQSVGFDKKEILDSDDE